jgi:hypothetical protein
MLKLRIHLYLSLYMFLKSKNTIFFSSNHNDFGTCKLKLEEPVTQIDDDVNLVVFCCVKYRFLIFHVHRHKLVTDLRGVFLVVYQVKLFAYNV